MPKTDNRPKYTNARAIKVHRLRKDGHTWAEIQERMDISADTALRWNRKVEDDPVLKAKANGTGNGVANTARAWLRKHPNGSHADFVAAHGSISTSYFSTLRKQVKNGKKAKELASSVNDVPSDEKLKEDNEFLLWWNKGERRGWVDRLLREVQE